MADDSAYDPQPGSDIPDRDPILDALCCFDAIAALGHHSSSQPRPGATATWGSEFYPSFGSYYSRRSEPWWTKLVTDREFRTAVLGDVSDGALADALWEVAAQAERVGDGGWGVWSVTSAPVRQLIAAAQDRET
ncbi:hypothetical protein [Nocardia sp. NPDC050435]|uniref:hypothetical protein n=1 Tax=Nocardia sp. NPDC050435 TaxID=3155040 RepID=UPI0033CEB768